MDFHLKMLKYGLLAAYFANPLWMRLAWQPPGNNQLEQTLLNMGALGLHGQNREHGQQGKETNARLSSIQLSAGFVGYRTYSVGTRTTATKKSTRQKWIQPPRSPRVTISSFKTRKAALGVSEQDTSSLKPQIYSRNCQELEQFE